MNVLLLALSLTAYPMETCARLDEGGRKEEAICCYQTLLDAGPDRRAEAQLHTRLAWLHWKLGAFEQSLASFDATLAIARETGDRTLEGHTVNFIGLLHQIVGDSAAAITHYRQALAIARELDDPKLMGMVLYHLGWVSFVRGDYAAAMTHYEEALAVQRRIGDRKAEALSLLGIGMTRVSLSQFEEALTHFREALPVLVDLGEKEREADARDHIGHALTWLGRPAEAIEYHTVALEIRGGLGLWNNSFALIGLSRAQEALGHVADAAARMQQVVEIVEDARRKNATRAFRSTLYAGRAGHYERLIALRTRLGEHAAAFTASERSRARLTLDSVQEEIDRRDGEPLTAEQIQAEVLDDETVIIEYALGRQKSIAWTVTRDSIEAHELPSRAVIEEAAVRLHGLLSAGDQRANRHAIDTLIDKVSAMLIAPLDLPRGARRLIVVPDGALFYVPFAALERRGVALIERYELTTAPSASALALLRRATARRSHEAAVVVFADPVFRGDDPRVRGAASRDTLDPDLVRSVTETGLGTLSRLPSTRTEANAIARFAASSRKALDFEASRATLSSENFGRYRVVHFATHALVNAQHPERSGIVLSLFDRQGRPVDGFLRVADLYTLDVPADLVVLSACRTGLGKELRGEGIVGLVSGFMHAGAPRVVASYWDVKDAATAELMRRFYRALFTEQLPPAAALRAAQRSMRSEERFRSPYYWAAFSLYGLE